jgi:hypothetical protein
VSNDPLDNAYVHRERLRNRLRDRVDALEVERERLERLLVIARCGLQEAASDLGARGGGVPYAARALDALRRSDPSTSEEK